MPTPKDPKKFEEYQEKQRKIALERGFGKWMKGRKDTPGSKAVKEYALSVKGKILKIRCVHFCELCKKKFYPYPYEKGRRYCSRECYLASAVRKQEYAKRTKDYWKDKPKKYDQRPYQGCNSKYTKWRTAVFKRDSWTCKTCGGKGYVESHHIKSWANFPKLRYRVSNGMTLCKECHKLANKIQRKNERQYTIRKN